MADTPLSLLTADQVDAQLTNYLGWDLLTADEKVYLINNAAIEISAAINQAGLQQYLSTNGFNVNETVTTFLGDETGEDLNAYGYIIETPIAVSSNNPLGIYSVDSVRGYYNKDGITKIIEGSVDSLATLIRYVADANAPDIAYFYTPTKLYVFFNDTTFPFEVTVPIPEEPGSSLIYYSSCVYTYRRFAMPLVFAQESGGAS